VVEVWLRTHKEGKFGYRLGSSVTFSRETLNILIEITYVLIDARSTPGDGETRGRSGAPALTPTLTLTTSGVARSGPSGR